MNLTHKNHITKNIWTTRNVKFANDHLFLSRLSKIINFNTKITKIDHIICIVYETYISVYSGYMKIIA